MDCLHEWDGWQQQAQVGVMAAMGLALSHTKSFEDRYFQATCMAQQIMHDDAAKGQRYDPQVALWQVAELYCVASKKQALKEQLHWMEAVMPKLIEAWCEDHGLDYRLYEAMSDKDDYYHSKRKGRPPSGPSRRPKDYDQLELYPSGKPVKHP